MAQDEKFDCIIVGVGGQGSIFASGVLGETALREGYEVISAETHGMAQRGGTVEVHVRIGTSVRATYSIAKCRRHRWLGACRVLAIRTLSFV